jgi:predicted HicB family RNase H-like nuclease
VKHKGYAARIELDQEAGVFHGEVLGIVDVVTFHGKSAEEVIQAFKDSVDDYLAFCEERGEQPDKPYSGKFVLRMEPTLHRQASVAAEEAGVSLNAWVCQCVEECLDRPHRKAFHTTM